MPRRSEMWERLGPKTDLLVIGGGITGAGIARDAARRGLSVTLVEQRDLAYGTSSRSSKLVHGGLRYLEHYEFSLVFEAVSERRILLDIAPHIVNPLGFLFPVYEGSRRGLGTITAGMWLYEGLSLFRTPKRHRLLKVEEVEREEPALNRDGLKGAPLYYDCATDDARLTLETALDAVDQGATVVTWARAERLLFDEAGRVAGAEVEDAFGGGRREVRARVVVAAAGPWCDEVRRMARPDAEPILRPTKGVHVVVPHTVLPIRHAVVCFHPVDDRVLFAIPWGDHTYVGTTDTDDSEPPETVAADASDVAYLIEAARRYFPEHPIRQSDIVSTWAGLRPLVADEDTTELDESMVSREHRIVIDPSGLVSIAGGKLTTYRRMAAEVVDTAVKLLRITDALPENLGAARTDEVPLPGARGWPEDDDHERVARQVLAASGGFLETRSAQLLADTYGMRGLEIAARVKEDPSLAAPLVEGRPEILAQVDFAVEEELAVTVEDVLLRRTQIFYRDADQGLGIAPRVAGRMGDLLGWDAATREAQVEAYRETVMRSRRWREGGAA